MSKFRFISLVSGRRKLARGFSLLELLVSVAIMAMAIAAVSVQWATPVRHAKFAEAVRQLKRVDMQSRQHARAMRAPVRINLDTQVQKLSYTRYGNSGHESEMKVALMAGIQIRIHSRNGVLENQQDDQLNYTINSFGMSDSFVVQMSYADKTVWVGFAGGTGQTTTYESKNEIQLPVSR